jgi:hypothetical protein
MFYVFTFVSGQPIHRGSYLSQQAAAMVQSSLWRQGRYFVPVYSDQRAAEERLTQYIR